MPMSMSDKAQAPHRRCYSISSSPRTSDRISQEQPVLPNGYGAMSGTVTGGTNPSLLTPTGTHSPDPHRAAVCYPSKE